ncbi:hypothetical protein ACFYXC_39465 [Streptomyces sp. NPDC002701]|uniref:hypothetical protein n=1 Tax=Streptomyces sp. NPDC002701 TaxID=3364661 RepID=UPI0036C21CBC
MRGIALRAERLRPAARATQQLTLDGRDEKLHHLEAVLDRARARFGPGAAGAPSAFNRLTTP